jgi:hypothetical protein
MLLYRGSSIGINKRQGKFSPNRFLVCGCANLLACPMLSWWLLWMDENDLQFGFFLVLHCSIYLFDSYDNNCVVAHVSKPRGRGLFQRCAHVLGGSDKGKLCMFISTEKL